MYVALGLGRAWKSKAITRSNWESPELSYQQEQYAAMDALAGRDIFFKFLGKPNASLGEIQKFCEMGNILAAPPPPPRVVSDSDPNQIDRQAWKSQKFEKYKERASRVRPCYDNCRMLGIKYYE